MTAGISNFRSPPAHAVAAPPSRLRIALILGIFALAYFAIQLGIYTQESATFDEPVHLVAGYVALRQGDHRIEPTHPPFLRIWAALPLLGVSDVKILRPPLDKFSQRDWISMSFFYAHDMLYKANNADRLLYPARFMIVILGALLGVMLFCWAYEWFGLWPAAGALGFYLIEPNLLTYFSLVTTDGGLVCFYFGTIYFLWRGCRQFTPANLAGLASCFALAMVSKYSAVLLGPIVLVLLVVAACNHPTTITWRRALAVVGMLIAASYLAIWAVYGFRYAPSADADWIFHSEKIIRVNGTHSVIYEIVNWLDEHRLLPNAYTQGFVLSFGTSEPMAGYLAGEISSKGWWYYFPVAFLVKTPAGLLFFALAGIVFACRRRPQLGTANVLFAILPAVIYFAVAMTSSINLGVRHLLPIFPFVLLVALLGMRELLALNGRFRWIPVVVPAGFWLVTFVAIYPHTLTFFNRFSGGPRKGLSYLSDSNIDWGQYLKLLKRWVDDNHVQHLNLAYFGMADPAYYGIPYSYLPGTALARGPQPEPKLPGYVAIGATIESGVFLPKEWRIYYQGFRNQQPVAILGNAVKIYWIESWPGVALPAGTPASSAEVDRIGLVAERLLSRMRWYGQASIYYREFLRHRPGATDAAMNFGIALLESNQVEEALGVYADISARNSTNGQLHRAIASQLLSHRQPTAARRYAQESARLLPESLRSRILLEMIQNAIDDPNYQVPAEVNEIHGEPLK
ncbi:glycosyltransferase family 39 protein [Oleiharenicola lentus]|uniref:glycosyltransferase family 39 protein n=1 Tax=Oleiharenicola lentus TaxID=2508720 RepID=UPI003F67175D